MATISKLASSQYITSKCHSRNGNDIKFIIPHHMEAHWTGAQCAQYFVNNKVGTSANYCNGYDGDISCNVPEEYAAYTSGSQQADKRAITIECSDTTKTNFEIPAKTQESLIQLMVDLIQRYPSLGGKAVYDESDRDLVVAAKNGKGSWDAVKGNIILHEWTTLSGTTCPGWHMKQILPNLVAEVNKRLAAAGSSMTKSGSELEGATATTRQVAQQVINGVYGNGKARVNALKKAGYDATKVQAQVDLMLAKDLSANIKTFIDNALTLQKGSQGEMVLVLQKVLKKMGYFTATPDGIFGNITDASVKAYQKDVGLYADGIFGPKSWTKLLG